MSQTSSHRPAPGASSPTASGRRSTTATGARVPLGFLGKLWFLLTRRERRGALTLIPAEIGMALAQTLGVASVVPFLTLVANPRALIDNAIYQRIDAVVHFATPRDALVVAGVASLVVLVLSNALAAFTAYLEARYVWDLHQKLQYRLMRTYLGRRYEFFLNRNSAELGKNILEEVSYVVTGVVIPFLQVVSSGLVSLFIVGLLIATDVRLGLVVLAAFGTLYAGSYALVNRYLMRLGSARVELGRGRFQSIREAFGAIKDVKAHGHEDVFLGDFDTYSRGWAGVTMRQSVVAQTPRFILEILAFGGIIGIVLYFVAQGEDLSRILPTLGLYAFGSYRLMPSLHRVYEATAHLRGSLAALDVLFADALATPASVDVRNDAAPAGAEGGGPDGTTPAVRTRRGVHASPGVTAREAVGAGTPAAAVPERLVVERELTFKGVRYRYPGAAGDALHGIDLSFPAGSCVALVGGTGAGKTTLIDLLLGLLDPSAGQIRIDGAPIDDRRRAWQAGISYVPQHIFLADTSVAANIAFGVAAGEVSAERLERAARAAAIHDFIVGELPRGYATTVGEQGLRLSGGQRQRIGIARALYRDPAVLVLDEATNALDNVTEEAVIRGIREMPGERLVVMVAHRIHTVQTCDAIVVLEGGRVAERGTFEGLLASSALFRSLASESAPAPNREVA